MICGTEAGDALTATSKWPHNKRTERSHPTAPQLLVASRASGRRTGFELRDALQQIAMLASEQRGIVDWLVIAHRASDANCRLRTVVRKAASLPRAGADCNIVHYAARLHHWTKVQ